MMDVVGLGKGEIFLKIGTLLKNALGGGETTEIIHIFKSNLINSF